VFSNGIMFSSVVTCVCKVRYLFFSFCWCMCGFMVGSYVKVDKCGEDNFYKGWNFNCMEWCDVMCRTHVLF